MEFEFGEVDSIEKVPEQFRNLYAESNGKYVLNDTFKGVGEAILGLNKSLKASRAEAKDLKAKRVDLSKFAEFGETPDEIFENVTARINELDSQIKAGGTSKVNLDKVRQEMTQAHKAEMEKQTARQEALKNQLYTLLVENTASAAIAELKGVGELLMPFVKQNVKVAEEDGEFKVYVVDPAGDRRYSGVTGQPMSIKELVGEMKNNEKYGRLFDSETPNGGGKPPGGSQKPAPRPGTVLTPNQKIAQGLAKGQGERQVGRG